MSCTAVVILGAFCQPRGVTVASLGDARFSGTGIMLRFRVSHAAVPLLRSPERASGEGENT